MYNCTYCIVRLFVLTIMEYVLYLLNNFFCGVVSDLIKYLYSAHMNVSIYSGGTSITLVFFIVQYFYEMKTSNNTFHSADECECCKIAF